MTMTPEEYRQHSCLRKVPYTSRGEAKQMARVTNDRYGGGRIAPYHCHFEDHWHLGHNASKKQRRAGRAS